MSHFLKCVVTEMIMMARKTNVTDSHVFFQDATSL